MNYEQHKTYLVIVYDQHAEERNRMEIEDWKAVELAHFLSILQGENKKTLLESNPDLGGMAYSSRLKAYK